MFSKSVCTPSPESQHSPLLWCHVIIWGSRDAGSLTRRFNNSSQYLNRIFYVPSPVQFDLYLFDALQTLQIFCPHTFQREVPVLNLVCWCTSTRGVMSQTILGLVNYITTLLYCSVLSMDFSLVHCKLLFMLACMAGLGGLGSKDVWLYWLQEMSGGLTYISYIQFSKTVSSYNMSKFNFLC